MGTNTLGGGAGGEGVKEVQWEEPPKSVIE
jgi:hypothetical protein